VTHLRFQSSEGRVWKSEEAVLLTLVVTASGFHAGKSNREGNRIEILIQDDGVVQT
jgi:hypothetical protein